MNDSVQVNQVYLIFNRPQFLVDSSDNHYTVTPRACFLLELAVYCSMQFIAVVVVVEKVR